MTVSIKDDKKVWNRLKREVTSASRQKGVNVVDLGLFEGQGIDLVEYAAANEFGILGNVKKSNIAKVSGRSFLRRVFDEEKANLRKTLKIGLRKRSVNSVLNLRGALTLAGNFYIKKLKSKIRSDFYKINFPNRPSTIARKGSDKPLIDTTRMINSFTKRFGKRKV